MEFYQGAKEKNRPDEIAAVPLGGGFFPYHFSSSLERLASPLFVSRLQHSEALMGLKMEWEEREGPPWTSHGPLMDLRGPLGTSTDLPLVLALFFSF